MAEHKVNGGDMLLFIDPLGGTNYDTVVCLTSVGISDSVQPVDASSACGPDKSPGAVDISISFEGQHLQDPTSGDISGTDLRILLRAEQTIGWMLSPVSPQPGDEIQTGTGYLSELSSTYAFDSVGVFSGTIQPYGLPTTTVEPSGPTLSLGDNYAGGTIAYLDNTGQHGFVFLYDMGGYFWQEEIPGTLTGSNGTSIGSGDTNTSTIISSGATSYPALACVNGPYNGYNDWVFPSMNEMYEIINNKSYYPSIDLSGTYWTSTEYDSDNAYKCTTLGALISANKQNIYNVFPIRYF